MMTQSPRTNVLYGKAGEPAPCPEGGVQSLTEMPLVELYHKNDDPYSTISPSSLNKAPSSIRASSSDVGAATVCAEESFVREERLEHGAAIVCRGKRIHQVNNRTSPHHEDGRHTTNLLRGFYMIGSAFWAGVFFLMCLKILLFLFLEMMALQVHTPGANICPALRCVMLIGITLGIFSLSYCFSLGMVLAGAFVEDIWSGHYHPKLFCNRLGDYGVFVDWIYFCFFVLFPVLVLCLGIMVQKANAWSLALLVWFSAVSVLFVVFAVTIVISEVAGALQILSKEDPSLGKGIWQHIKTCLLLKQTAIYSGYKTIKYVALADSKDIPIIELSEGSSVLDGSRQEFTGLWSRFTKQRFLPMTLQQKWHLCCFFPVEPPKQLYTMDDIRLRRPYVTRHNWSIDRLFFWPRKSRCVAIVRGPEALTNGQLWSSLFWSILVVFMVCAVTVASLVWMPLPNWAFSIVIVLFGLASIPLVNDLWANFRITQQEVHTRQVKGSTKLSGSLTPNSFATSDSTRGVFFVTRRLRVTEATEGFCWLAMTVEVSLFLVYPFASLSMAGNIPLALLFFVAVGVSAIRHYIDLVAVAEETGFRNSFLPMCTPSTAWTDLTMLTSLIRRAKYSRTSRLLFQFVLAGCSIIVFLVFVGASSDSVESTSTKALTLVDGFRWNPTHSPGPYAACELPTKHRFGPNTTLADYVFLSILAYKTDAVAELQLQDWFQNTKVLEDSQTVRQFRLDNGFDQSPVFFRLFRFPMANGKDTGVISIRGTQNNWEILADLQLWSAAILCQGLRMVLPIGEAWTPILDEMISLVSLLRGSTIKGMAFYKVTTAFALALKSDTTFDGVHLTGHSLGGGLAMISSAQTSIPSVAVSGPNAMLTGKTFEPKVLPDQLHEYTFNIVPDKDWMPRFDDLAQNYQNIRCLSDQYAFVTCHDYVRSLCEILTSCGNHDRPAVCNCVYEYGYPIPTTLDPNDRTTFEEACRAQGYDTESQNPP